MRCWVTPIHMCFNGKLHLALRFLKLRVTTLSTLLPHQVNNAVMSPQPASNRVLMIFVWFMSCVVPSHTEEGTREMIKKLLGPVRKRHCGFHLVSGISWHERSQQPCWGTLKQFCGMSTEQGTEASCEQPAQQPSAGGMNQQMGDFCLRVWAGVALVLFLF